jgi:hypothetical protein
MTESQIKNTVEMVKTAIAAKAGKRTKFSKGLKKAVLAAVSVVDPAQFSKESGLSLSLISRWNRTLKIERKRSESVRNNDLLATSHHGISIKSNSPKARELFITPTTSPLVTESKIPGRAVIRAGDQLEIEVPLDLLTPHWISEVLSNLKSRKEMSHV